jgi:hypothetical protein
MVGTGRFELPTCRLGGGRSIHLSYVPTVLSIVAGLRRRAVRWRRGAVQPYAALRYGAVVLSCESSGCTRKGEPVNMSVGVLR